MVKMTGQPRSLPLPSGGVSGKQKFSHIKHSERNQMRGAGMSWKEIAAENKRRKNTGAPPVH